jgi:WD40 repeat protein
MAERTSGTPILLDELECFPAGKFRDTLSTPRKFPLAGEKTVFSPDGRRMVTSSKATTVRIWDAETLKQIAVLTGHVNMVYSVAFSPDGRHIVSASWDNTARLWDAESHQQIGVFRHDDPGCAAPMATHSITSSAQQRHDGHPTPFTRRNWGGRPDHRRKEGIFHPINRSRSVKKT